MLHYSDALLLEHARDHAERLRAEARDRTRLAYGAAGRRTLARGLLSRY